MRFDVTIYINNVQHAAYLFRADSFGEALYRAAEIVREYPISRTDALTVTVTEQTED